MIKSEKSNKEVKLALCKKLITKNQDASCALKNKARELGGHKWIRLEK